MARQLGTPSIISSLMFASDDLTGSIGMRTEKVEEEQEHPKR